MSAAFTPGPWTVEISDGPWVRECFVRAEKWGCVARIGLEYSLPHWDVPQRANARLIAAAPTGLAVAERTYLAILKMPFDTYWRTVNQQVYCDLRDFIADATGRDGEEVQNEFEAKAEGL